MKTTVAKSCAVAVWCLIGFNVYPQSGSGQERSSRRVSIDTAKKLVYEAIKTHNRGADVSETEKSPDPAFYFFQATWPNPKGSPVIGYFAVNPWTGDVWDFGACRRLDSRSLRKLQEEARKLAGITTVNEDLRDKRPLCIGHGDRD